MDPGAFDSVLRQQQLVFEEPCEKEAHFTVASMVWCAVVTPQLRLSLPVAVMLKSRDQELNTDPLVLQSTSTRSWMATVIPIFQTVRGRVKVSVNKPLEGPVSVNFFYSTA